MGFTEPGTWVAVGLGTNGVSTPGLGPFEGAAEGLAVAERFFGEAGLANRVPLALPVYAPPADPAAARFGFTSWPPTAAEAIREATAQVERWVSHTGGGPGVRELRLAITNLEQAGLWAHKGVALHLGVPGPLVDLEKQRRSGVNAGG